MEQQFEATSRDAALVEDAHVRPMMGFEVLEPVPTRTVPYERLDPFILVHESRFKLSELADVDTKHPHRGFDNLWYILEGTASTGHSTGPGGTIERVRPHTDLTVLAKLSCALARAQVVPLAA